MTNSASQAEIMAASTYDELHVPALFGQWIERVANAANIQSGQRVLDVACGTGILTREVSSRIGHRGKVCGLDPNPGMLAVAKRKLPTIEWKEGTAEDLPYEDGSFDIVVSQFGLMFFRDRPGALREMLRVLVPDGRLAVAVWDSLETAPAYATLATMLERIAGPRAARALRMPFSLGDRSELGKLFQEAGVGSGRIETVHGTACFPEIRVMVEAELRGWLPVMRVHLAEEQIQRVLSESEEELSRYLTTAGTVEFKLSAHIVAATKPPA